MEFSLVRCRAEDAEELAVLASVVWREHYAALLTPGQIDYMLERFQSPEAIRTGMAEGARTFFACVDGKRLGYLSVKEQPGSLYVSKLYLLRAARGMGFGRRMIDYAAREAQKAGLSALTLNVNKYNESSIAFYRKMGFETVESVVVDIGNGYVMDDFVMEKVL